jgi:hypothetical protein
MALPIPINQVKLATLSRADGPLWIGIHGRKGAMGTDLSGRVSQD